MPRTSPGLVAMVTKSIWPSPLKVIRCGEGRSPGWEVAPQTRRPAPEYARGVARDQPPAGLDRAKPQASPCDLVRGAGTRALNRVPRTPPSGKTHLASDKGS